MKHFLALIAVLMWLTLSFAFAGGGSEVGDGRSSHTKGSAPIPLPGDPRTDPKRPPTYDVASVDYSATELKAGEKLIVNVVVNSRNKAVPPSICGGWLVAGDFSQVALPDEDCSVAKLGPTRFGLALVYRFPAATPSREYFAAEVNVNGESLPLVASPRAHVHGAGKLADLDMLSVKLTTGSDGRMARHGENFYVEAQVRTSGTVAGITLAYLLDQGKGLEPRKLMLTTGGFSQERKGDITLVRVPLLSEIKTVRKLEFRRIHLVNSALQAVTFILPESFVVDFE